MQNSPLDSVRWPQVGLLAVILAAAVAAIVLVPEAKWHVIPWGSIAAGITLVGSALVALFMKPVVDPEKAADRRAERAKSDPPPRPVRTDREGGFVDVRLLYLIAAAALTALGCAVLPGCGASQLQAHATATAIAGIAVESAEDIYAAHLDAAQDRCSDEACVLAARESHAPAEAAIALARVANGVYRDAIQIANEAEESPALLSALVTAALRLAARWAEVVAIMAGLGVEVPAIPGLGS